MEFHQSASERFAEQLFNYVLKEFNGKTINSEDCNLETLMSKLPKNFDDDINIEDFIPDKKTPADIQESTENTENAKEPEVFQDNIDSPKSEKKKKKKKEKKKKEVKSDDNVDKPKRKPNPFLKFKTSEDNQEAINQKAEEIDEDTGKKYGKVKAAGFLWRELTQEQQDEWKDK